MKLVLTPFLTTEIIERIQKINLIAPMMLTRNLIKKKKMKNPSSIVFTASPEEYSGYPQATVFMPRPNAE